MIFLHLCSFIAVGSVGEVWGVNKEGDVYKREDVGTDRNPTGRGWTRINAPKPMKQLDVHDGTVWAIGTDDSIWYSRNGNGWKQIDGLLKVVSVGKAGVWGVNSKDEIFYRQGTSVNPKSDGTGWVKTDGRLSYIDVPFAGNAEQEVWGVNSEGKIYRKKWSKNVIYPRWELMGRREMKQLAVAEGRVWAVAKDDTIWQTEVGQ